MKSSNEWRQNYAQWIQKVGANAMQGATGTTTTPPGMVGQQYAGRPQDFSQQGPNALMHGGPQQMPMQGMQPQGIPHDLQNNAIYTDTMRMLGR